jgi:hypothetical protein
MERCETCRHWGEPNPDALGSLSRLETIRRRSCSLINADESNEAKIEVVDHGEVGLMTSADFGCVLWEQKADVIL